MISIRSKVSWDKANGSGLMRQGIRSSSFSTLKRPGGIASYRYCAWSRAVRLGAKAVQAIEKLSSSESTAVGDFGFVERDVAAPHQEPEYPKSAPSCTLTCSIL